MNGKYRVTLHALANMKAVTEVEAMSAVAAREKALNALGDQDWKYQGLDENAEVEMEVECLVPGEVERKAEARRLITEHWESVKGKIIYASSVLAFDKKDDRDERMFDPPIPFRILDSSPALAYLDRGDWMDSEYDVEPLFADPRLAGLRTFDVNGRSVCLMTENRDKLFPHCDDPTFVVVGLSGTEAPGAPATHAPLSAIWQELQDNRLAGVRQREVEFTFQQELIDKAVAVANELNCVFDQATRLAWPTGRAYEGEPRRCGPRYVDVSHTLFSRHCLSRFEFSTTLNGGVNSGQQVFRLPDPRRLALDQFALKLIACARSVEILIFLSDEHGRVSKETKRLQSVAEFAVWLHQQIKERR